jgi:tRNA 2-thiouridine synthesizing protein B
MLHIVNKSHTQTDALRSCLRLALPGHALLLTEDAVYAATKGGAEASGLVKSALQIYVLQPDVEARGMAGRLIDGVTAIDYGGFVDLVAAHPNNQSWL